MRLKRLPGKIKNQQQTDNTIYQPTDNKTKGQKSW